MPVQLIMRQHCEFGCNGNLLGVSICQMRQRQNGRHFTDDTFKCIFLNENVRISIKISLEAVPKGPITNIPALIQIMAWHWPGNKPFSEPMMPKLLTHICVTRPQWVKENAIFCNISCYAGHLIVGFTPNQPCLNSEIKILNQQTT